MERKHLRIDLKKRRKSLGYTQKEIAKKLNVSIVTLQNWEQRKVSIGSIHLKMYAKALKLDPLDIIDPDHEFNHYEDTEEFKLEHIKTIKQIENRCIRLVAHRVSDVYDFATKQLNTQEAIPVTYKGLLEKKKTHTLIIKAEAHSDNDVRMFDDLGEYPEKFHGTIPEDYDICMKVMSEDVGEYSNGQKVFLRRASNEILYSGVNVVAELGGKTYIRKFRSTFDHFYLIPVNSESAAKDDTELNGEESKYIWHPNDKWIVKYIINQSAF
ncbi:XRE family transcriptional regulator [Apilactobacillus micheneri]|uniref:helix-turn-helix domain-containing protein n=1 Tax=Apilactobacillus micheneri TaxID=1899430 RepID=UPI00112B2E02|nr:helix-turn-helix transcriptional regulator [Apilactobacillus micheneri]TPR47018.1 XRE family transcriptional regulator [Apilactobacillus micheneri]